MHACSDSNWLASVCMQRILHVYVNIDCECERIVQSLLLLAIFVMWWRRYFIRGRQGLSRHTSDGLKRYTLLVSREPLRRVAYSVVDR